MIHNNENTTSALADGENIFNFQTTVPQEDRQVGQQYSDLIKLNFNARNSATATILEEKTAKAEDAIKGTNFDDILERRDLEVTTKQSPKMSIEDTDGTNDNSTGNTRQSMPLSLGGNNFNLKVKPLEEQPYSITAKQYQTVKTEASEHR